MGSKGIASKIILGILIILIILIALFSIYIVQNDKISKIELEEILLKVEEEEANLTEYIVYGTHLNLKGDNPVSLV